MKEIFKKFNAKNILFLKELLFRSTSSNHDVIRNEDRPRTTDGNARDSSIQSWETLAEDLEESLRLETWLCSDRSLGCFLSDLFRLCTRRGESLYDDLRLE